MNIRPPTSANTYQSGSTHHFYQTHQWSSLWGFGGLGGPGGSGDSYIWCLWHAPFAENTHVQS